MKSFSSKKNSLLKSLIIGQILIVLFSNSCSTDNENISTDIISKINNQSNNLFVFENVEKKNNSDFFEIEKIEDKIKVSATDYSTKAYALNYFLRNNCNIDVTENNMKIDQNKIPKQFDKISKDGVFDHRYYLNYCTFNYTMSFWDWARWEREIDWMALNGINMSLAIIGTEAVWQNTLTRFGFSNEEIMDFIVGPAFTAWWLMGNIEGWGGPVSQEWINDRVVLQKKILGKMKSYDIKPVLQGFYGMVPFPFIKKYPESKIVDTGKWVEFQRPAFILPSDPMFDDIASVYYEELEKLYGKVDYFGGDPFHEDEHDSFKNVDFEDAGKLIQKSMMKNNNDATWLLQGWWSKPSDEMLTGLKKENTLILDLWGDHQPAWEKERKGFNGHNWVWCTLQNFGDKVGLFGKLDHYFEEVKRAIKSEKGEGLSGIGTIMEGISSNKMVYEMIYDLAWADSSFDTESWISNYSTYKYGKENNNAKSAWNILHKTVYSAPLNQEQANESIFCARPSLDGSKVNVWGSTEYNYDNEELIKAFNFLLSSESELIGSDNYRYDLVDVLRQIIANKGLDAHKQMIQNYKDGNIPEFEKNSKVFLQMVSDQDSFLSTREEFSFYNWVIDARNMATTEKEKDLFEWNARTLVTLWGGEEPSKELHEYSHREWAGLLKEFYHPRWKIFIDSLKSKMDGKDIKEIDFYNWENEWTKRKSKYNRTISNDELLVVKKIAKKYSLINK